MTVAESADGLIRLDPVSPPAAVLPHAVPVDIIICVHNALSDVRNCLSSVVRYTSPPYRLILVDDGSDRPTQEYLQDFSTLQDALLLRNEQAQGYTRAANLGLRHACGDLVVLLNSDTVVGPQWLDRMAACALSDHGIGLVGPLSNVASWQSIPELFDAGGEWSQNDRPQGLSVVDMAEWVARHSARLYPRLPFLNGFCLMIRRDVVQQIGPFDEAAYPEGYGEENDYCMRVRDAGWQLAVADDVYIHHAQSRSYSHERRRRLSEKANEKLVARYGQADLCRRVVQCQFDRAMLGIRARSCVMAAREGIVRQGRGRWEGSRVAFILPVAISVGGAHVVIQEAAAMQKMGVDVRLVNSRPNQADFERFYPDNPVPVIYAEGRPDAPKIVDRFLPSCDAIIATAYFTVRWFDAIPSSGRPPVRAYYVQDYEPQLLLDNPAFRHWYQDAVDSYTYRPDLVRFTKTEWNRRMVQENLGVECTVVGPSVDIDLFRPRPRPESQETGTPLRVAAMVRPSTPRRGPQLTMEVLREVSRRHGAAVEIILFGCEPDDAEFRSLPLDFSWRHAGILTRPELASLMNLADVFVDFSTYQAMGLTAMEAMACGASVIVPKNGGSDSYARDGVNALVVDTSSRTECLAALERMLEDTELRTRIQRQGLADICHHSPEAVAWNILEALLSDGSPGSRS